MVLENFKNKSENDKKTKKYNGQRLSSEGGKVRIIVEHVGLQEILEDQRYVDNPEDPSVEERRLLMISLEDLEDAIHHLGRKRLDCISRRVCIWCGEPAIQFSDKLSAKEYIISALCQTCQDRTFDENL